jgi:hypothetical protein
MPRKRAKTEKEKKLIQEIEEEEMATLEEELEPEELESLEEEYEEEALEDLDEADIEQIAAAEATDQGDEAAPEVADVAAEPRPASADADIGMEAEAFAKYEEEVEEEEVEIREVPLRRETRQELLGRLMAQLLSGREQVHTALERVRDLNTQLRDAGSRPPEKLKEQYHKAITDLSRARREENFARAELMQVLNWRG